MEQTSTGEALPYVSVLITTFNHQEYIRRCIDSILEQRCPFPIEILVLDDASTDSTQEIILSYSAKFPKIIKPFLQLENLYSQLKKGMPKLIENAHGAYIAYCDGDDYWTDPEKLVKQVTFLEANPSFVLTFHNTINVDQSGLVISEPYAIAFPPEYNLMPNGDNFIPMLLAAFGGAKYQPEIGPLAYRQHDAGAYSAKTNDERTRMHIQTYLQIASYYIRKNELVIAQKIAAQHLIPRLSTYLKINLVP